MISTLLMGLAVVAGAAIGLLFGRIQDAAARRNARLQNEGRLASGWAVMPGSFRRVAYLLIALVIVQVVCPLLFSGGYEWFVSGGLVAGYGWTLYQGLTRRRSSGA
jgi:hypothetical protein